MNNFDRCEAEYLEEPEDINECDCGTSIPEGYIVCKPCGIKDYQDAKLHEAGLWNELTA